MNNDEKKNENIDEIISSRSERREHKRRRKEKEWINSMIKLNKTFSL